MILRFILPLGAALALNALGPGAHAAATLDLADAPLFSTVQVPGNLALDLSVEYPTANSVAHIDAVYNSSSTYLGYFDPDKCYVYKYVEVESGTNLSHFAPGSVAAAHLCTGAADNMWSGNYMNWATTQTIDPFRWVMTGGYRVVDTSSLTLLEKAWGSGQGGTDNFPDRVLDNTADIQAATPFSGLGRLTALVQGRGQRVHFGGDGFLGSYFNGMNLDLGGAKPVLTRRESINFDWGRGSPATGVSSDHFSVRWVGSLTALTTGSYAFRTTSDDGVRLWVDGKLLIDNWTVHGPTDNVGSISLTAGQTVSVKLEYFENVADAIIQLAWKRPSDADFNDAVGEWDVPIRVKVCDPGAPGGLEANCVAYASGNYKPEGLVQQYANKIRFSVFGYLNDSDLKRDAGVLRAAQKFVGPTYPVPGSVAVSNPAAEWDASTGVFVKNPDIAAASATDTPITNSGAINYINKFGEITPGAYKVYDPVGELYYASLRYFKNLGNVVAWSDMSTANAATKSIWADGFPVIRKWVDPIQYACQKNFILGIGDVNTHADKNVPGPTSPLSEPGKPSEVVGDASYTSAYNAVTATNKVGELQGMGAGLGLAMNIGGCCNNNSALMAGLAYDANTRDIRADLPGRQSVQTYWIDVLEYQTYKPNNQFFLAAKYGGFNVPDGFDPYARTTPLLDSWWHTNADTVGTGAGAQARPDNYFTGGRPDLMVAGLTSAFAQIADALGPTPSTGFAPATPNLDSSGAPSYSSSYNPKNWTGTVYGTQVTNVADGKFTGVQSWDAGAWLDATAYTTRKIATCCKADGGGLPFNAKAMAAGTLSNRTLYTSFASVPGVSAAGQSATNFLNYLRGDRTLELGQAGGVYRKRDHVMGDIVNSKLWPVPHPYAVYYDASNPGYSAFKRKYTKRHTVVYAGSNDGMLHALDGSIPGDGHELFAYVPSFVYGTASTYASTGLAALGNPRYAHSYRVDGYLLSGDVNFNQTYGVTGGGDALATGDWHTVLVGGLGKGGKGFFAIDITDPSAVAAEADLAAKVLWEFPATPEAAKANHALDTSAAAAATMGYSYGEPQIVKTARFGWVALLTSGYNNAGGRGYLYIVDIHTGALLDTIATPAEEPETPINLTQVVAYIPEPSNYLVDAAYGADMRGNVWRFDLSGTGAYSAPTKIAVLTNAAGTRQSVTVPLRIAIDAASSNKRYVLVGTGQLLGSSDINSTETQTFYALLDGDKKQFFTSDTLPAGASYPITRGQLKAVTDVSVGATDATLGWYFDVKYPGGSSSIAYRVITPPPVTGFGYVAFNAFQPGGDACSPDGISHTFRLSFATGKKLNTTDPDYIETNGLVTDLNAVSINGRDTTLITNKDGTQAINGPPGQSVFRRLNWREVQTGE